MSHYIMLVVDPAAPRPTSGTRSGGGKARRFLGTVYHIDSRSGRLIPFSKLVTGGGGYAFLSVLCCVVWCCRGPSYARRMHPVWRRCEQQLRAGIFRQCRWLSVVREDLQVSEGMYVCMYV